MTTPKLRYSPSGGIVQNSNGGELVPGTGMMLRLAEGYTLVGGDLQLSTTPETLGTQLGAGTVLVQTLPGPNPDLRYRASLSVDATNDSTSTPAQVVLFIDTSVDDLNWVEQVNNVHSVGVGEIIGMHCRLDLTMRLGSELVGGLPAGAPSLRVRGRIATVTEVVGVEVNSKAGSGPYNDFVGTCLLQLSEHF